MSANRRNKAVWALQLKKPVWNYHLIHKQTPIKPIPRGRLHLYVNHKKFSNNWQTLAFWFWIAKCLLWSLHNNTKTSVTNLSMSVNQARCLWLVVFSERPGDIDAKLIMDETPLIPEPITALIDNYEVFDFTLPLISYCYLHKYKPLLRRADILAIARSADLEMTFSISQIWHLIGKVLSTSTSISATEINRKTRKLAWFASFL